MAEKIAMVLGIALVLALFVIIYNVSTENVEPMTEDVYDGMRGTIDNSLNQLP